MFSDTSRLRLVQNQAAGAPGKPSERPGTSPVMEEQRPWAGSPAWPLGDSDGAVASGLLTRGLSHASGVDRGVSARPGGLRRPPRVPLAERWAALAVGPACPRRCLDVPAVSGPHSLRVPVWARLCSAPSSLFIAHDFHMFWVCFQVPPPPASARRSYKNGPLSSLRQQPSSRSLDHWLTCL